MASMSCFRFLFELPPLVILRRSFNEEECVLRLNLFLCVVLCIFQVRIEATSSDPLLEADSDRSRESDNTKQFSCDVDDQYVPKIGMLFGSLEEARKFYADYARRVGFSTKIRNTNRSKKSNQILNQLLSCNREGKRRSDVPVSEKTNAIYAANCPARINPTLYVGRVASYVGTKHQSSQFNREPTYTPTSYVRGWRPSSHLRQRPHVIRGVETLYVEPGRSLLSFIPRGNDTHFTVVLLVRVDALAEIRAYQYVHHLNMIDSWEISKVVLEHSHHCCPIQAEMFPQYRLKSMQVRPTIEIHD
ncbi:hypothetical protein PIB30_042904 [Stylosanthes scabra]|uniref:FAR1 domain-containing protein n=1 Tax=Stylosanthes scabra TaxID=79078 RepID=A0ABU6TEZ4_9FABA|nr:hypothetical protein [Stylosanthes scabra]